MRKLFLLFIIILTFNFQLSTFNSTAQTTVCQGDTVILIVDNPAGSIQWQQSADQVVWTNIAGATNDSLRVQAISGFYYRTLINDALCTISYNYYSDTLNFVVINQQPVSVNISVYPMNTVYTGTNVTFTASPINGGISPSYQWKKNGSDIFGANGSTYSTSTLANNDAVSCIMSSSAACITGNPATSNTITIAVCSNINIGCWYAGGIVAYILQAGDPGYINGQTHGIIVSPNDQSTNLAYSLIGNTTIGASGTSLGTGNTNTNTIIANQGAGSYAARICYDLVSGGYSDWYLPSKDELNKVYLNKLTIGGLNGDLYWSSSEHDQNNAYIQRFSDGLQALTMKATSFHYVRAVRSF